MEILHTLLHLATTSLNEWTWQNFSNLVDIDGIPTVSSLTYLYISCFLQGFAHTFGKKWLVGINTQIGEYLRSGH